MTAQTSMSSKYSIVEHEPKPFMDIVEKMEYRFSDIREAKEFGFESIWSCYYLALHAYSRYYTINDENDIPVVTYMVQRDGQLVFFISKHIEHPIAVVKVLKKEARRFVDTVGALFTKTALWYTEAQRFNRLIGFKDYIIYDEYGLYVLD